MPSLKEGIQYVGMVRPTFTEYDYILTDLSGNIDCFSQGITSLLGISPQLFKDNQNINIQILCPELIPIFEQRRLLLKQASQIAEPEDKDKINPEKAFEQANLAQPGGDSLAVILCNNFQALAKVEKGGQKQRGGTKKKKNMGMDQDLMGNPKVIRSPVFREFLKYLTKGRTYGKKCPDVKRLLSCKEYKDYEKLKIVQCELNLQVVRTHRSTVNSLKYLVFKILKIQGKKLMPDQELDIDAKSDQIELDPLTEFKNASAIIQEVYMQKDNEGVLGKQGTYRNQGKILPQGSKYSIMARGQTEQDDMRTGGVRFMNEQRMTNRDSNPYLEVHSQMPSVAQRQIKKVEFQEPVLPESNKRPIQNKMTLQNVVTFIDDKKSSDESENSSWEKSADGEDELEKSADDMIHKEKVQQPAEVQQQRQKVELLPEEETPRIDIKQEISVNDEMKRKTHLFSNTFSKSDSKSESKKSISKSIKKEKDDAEEALLSKEEEKKEKKGGNQSKLVKNSNMKSLKSKLKHDQRTEEEALLIKKEGDEEKKEDGKQSNDSVELEEMEEEIEEEIYEEIEEEFEEEDILDPDQQDISTQGDMMSGIQRSRYPDMSNIPQPKKKKIRNYEKIVTNPKYKNLDLESCGSAYFKDVEVGNDELEIRELIKKVEDRKQRRQQRMLKRQSDQQAHQNSQKEKKRQEPKKSDSQISLGQEELKEGNEEEEKKEEGQGEEDEESKDDLKQRLSNEPLDQGEVSSIASSIFSQTRTYQSLRNSIEERFLPHSVRNLKYMANLVFVILLSLDITYFVIQQNLFYGIEKNIDVIHYSQYRQNQTFHLLRVGFIIDINLRIQNLILANENITSAANMWGSSKSDYIALQNALLINSTTELKDSQTILSQSTLGFSEDDQKQINPQNIWIYYPNAQILPSVSYNIWESIMKVVVNAYQLSSTPLSAVSNNTLVQFIQNNCLNSNLDALKQSTKAIITASQHESSITLQLFFLLLIIVSCSLLLSIFFLLPIITRAKGQKEKVLELFLSKKIEKCIDDQLKICRWFLTKHQIMQDIIGHQNGQDIGDDNQNNQNVDENIQGVVDKNEIKKDKTDLYGLKSKKKKRKWKKLQTNYIFLSIRALLIVIVFQAFFLGNYLDSESFLKEVNQLTDELQLLISRNPQLQFLLLLEKQFIYSKNTSQVLFQSVQSIINQQFGTLAEDQQSLLDIYSSNNKYHTPAYNEKFSQLMYNDVCSNFTFNDTKFRLSPTEINLDECQLYDQAILKKGLYSSVIQYWTQIRKTHNQFLSSKMTDADVFSALNSQNLMMSERLVDLYFQEAHADLIQILEEDIKSFFEAQLKQDEVIFILFVIYLFVSYIFAWNLFIKRLVDELWKSKQLLSVLPIEICFKLDDIRKFITKNSSQIRQ